MTKKEVLMNQVDEIMDSFDFRQVESVMHHLNWTWNDSKTPPDEYEIRREARRIMNIAIQSGESVSTGGFIARLHCGEENGKKWARIDLAFAVEDSFNEGESYDEE
jgi:hypothetical protein